MPEAAPVPETPRIQRAGRDWIIGLIVGLGGGLSSLGGGTLMIPMLTGFGHLDQYQARGTALAAAMVTAVSGSLIYGMHGCIDWRTILFSGLPAMIIAPITTRLSSQWPQHRLRRLLGLVILMGAILMVIQTNQYFAQSWPLRWLILVGLIAGVVAGSVGISGGPIFAPLYVLGLGLPQAIAQGSSLLARIPQILSAVWENHHEGRVCWRRVPMLGIGIVAGTTAGSWLAIHLPNEWLKYIFVILLILIGLNELLGPLTLHSPLFRSHHKE